MFPLADNEERIADITLTKDSTSIIAMTRSAVYEISGKKTDAANEKRDAISEKTNVTRKIIGQPEGFVPEVTLFKTVWNLHSGAFFGLAGRLVVDAIDNGHHPFHSSLSYPPTEEITGKRKNDEAWQTDGVQCEMA